MTLPRRLTHRSAGAAWRDPSRRAEVLECLAATEALGGANLRAAAPRLADPELRRHVVQHSAAALQHADLLQQRAAALRGGDPANGSGAGRSGSPCDLSGGRLGTGVDVAGNCSANLCDEVGAVAFVATLHAAGLRARQLYQRLHAAVREVDPASAAPLKAILAAADRRVEYSGARLEHWRQQGRGAEVDAALREARRSRLVHGWMQLGSHSGSRLARVLFFVFYWTLVAPLGLLSRRSRQRPAVHRELPAPTGMQSQY